MKRLQVRIDEDLDAALERQARNEGTSKAALIRRCLCEHLRPLDAVEQDALDQMVGADDFEPEPVDDVVY